MRKTKNPDNELLVTSDTLRIRLVNTERMLSAARELAKRRKVEQDKAQERITELESKLGSREKELAESRRKADYWYQCYLAAVRRDKEECEEDPEKGGDAKCQETSETFSVLA